MNKKNESKNKFTVTNPTMAFWLCLFIVAFFVVVIILNTIFSDQSPLVMCICITIFVFIPCTFVILWSKVPKITVDGEKITVRKWTGLKYSFNVSEITKVDWKQVVTRMGLNEVVLIRTLHGKKLSIETLMPGSEKMLAYIEQNVESTKINKTQKILKSALKYGVPENEENE